MDRDLMENGIVQNNLAACHIQMGDLPTALEKLRDAMKIISRLSFMGDDDPKIQRVMGNFAVAYIRLGDLDLGLNYVAKLLVLREESKGLCDAEVLNVLYMSGYAFLVKANQFDILQDCKRMDGKSMDKPVESNY